MFQADQIARDQHPVVGQKLQIEPDLKDFDVFFFRSPFGREVVRSLAALAPSS
jgi:hypothetical protein